MSYRLVLTDQAANVWLDSCHLDSFACGIPSDSYWSVRKHTCQGGLSHGVDVIHVSNGRLHFTVCPTRGMGILSAACDQLCLAWQSPVRGPVHPAFVDLDARRGLGWLRGFDELIVRCGLNFMGAPGRDAVRVADGSVAEMDLTLHGRIANIPARYVSVEISDESPPVISITGVVTESALFAAQLQLETCISTVAGSRRVTIADRVVNRGGIDAELELLYHCNFGVPLLGEQARVRAPFRVVAPRTPGAARAIGTFDRYAAPTPGFAEQVYFCELHGDDSGETLAMLQNADASAGVALRYNTGALPFFTLWKNTAAVADGYVTGLEPGTAYPNPRMFEREQGRVVCMPPGGAYETRLTMEPCPDSESVAQAGVEIDALQARGEATVYSEPQPKYAC